MEENKMAENKMAENKMAENKKRRLETKRRLANNKFVILPVSTTYTQPEGCKYVRKGTIGKDFYMYEEYY
jgi:hypothetical protein